MGGGGESDPKLYWGHHGVPPLPLPRPPIPIYLELTHAPPPCSNTTHAPIYKKSYIYTLPPNVRSGDQTAWLRAYHKRICPPTPSELCFYTYAGGGGGRVSTGRGKFSAPPSSYLYLPPAC